MAGVGKSNAERQKDHRTRLKEQNHISFSCFLTPAEHTSFKKAALVEEMTLEKWIKKCAKDRLKEILRNGKMRGDAAV